MIYPGTYRVTSPFGYRTINGDREYHRGIDVVGDGDKHVCSVCDGIVAVSTIITNKKDRTWEWGNYVRVDGSDGRHYYYCHLASRLVSAGRHIKAGEHVGIEGHTGYSFGNHCHFEVRDASGNAVDPAPFLGIPNAVGTYGTDWRDFCRQRFSLSPATMAYLDKYPYAADLYRKLAEGSSCGG